MIVAQTIDPGAMKAGTAFTDKITSIILEMGFTRIIETGCYLGEGTTRAITKAMIGIETVYSIEVNPGHVERAFRNNPSVNFINGLSIPRYMCPQTITTDIPANIVVDHFDIDRELKYKQELEFDVPDDRLRFALDKFNFEPHLVILDSAGHVGFIEFKYLMSLVKAPFYLALDDTNHLKHYHSMEYIKSHPEKFQIVWQTDEKFGSAIIRVC